MRCLIAFSSALLAKVLYLRPVPQTNNDRNFRFAAQGTLLRDKPAMAQPHPHKNSPVSPFVSIRQTRGSLAVGHRVSQDADGFNFDLDNIA